MYRVIREAVHNVVKHAQAGKVTIKLAQTEGKLVFAVTDDGFGFDTNAEFPGHLGLHSMRKRIQSFGGQLQLTSTKGQGTTVAGWLPLA